LVGAKRRILSTSGILAVQDVRKPAITPVDPWATWLWGRLREDCELDLWMSEIQLRACQRIGQLLGELETMERARTDLHPTNGKQTKAEALADAGLSTSTAHRYEELACGRTTQGHTIGLAATEAGFEATLANPGKSSTSGILVMQVKQHLLAQPRSAISRRRRCRCRRSAGRSLQSRARPR
jgi:hypothetical protein